MLEHDACHALVHRQRAREHARADVGQFQNLEEPLERAVFAHGSVYDWEDHVVAARAQRLREEGVELEPHGPVPGVGECLGDPRSGGSAHLGFGGGASLNDRNRQPGCHLYAFSFFDMSTSSIPRRVATSKIRGSR